MESNQSAIVTGEEMEELCRAVYALASGNRYAASKISHDPTRQQELENAEMRMNRVTNALTAIMSKAQ